MALSLVRESLFEVLIILPFLPPTKKKSIFLSSEYKKEIFKIFIEKIMSVFRRQKYLIYNSVYEKHFTIAFGVMDFSDADKRLCTDHPSANAFPRTTVGKLRGLSITDALAMHASAKSMGYWWK